MDPETAPIATDTQYYYVRLGENWIPGEPAEDGDPYRPGMAFYLPGSPDRFQPDEVGPQLAAPR